MDDDGIGHLPPLPNLLFLSLDRTGITDEGVAHLARFPRLRELALPDGVTGEGLVHLHGLTGLRWLRVRSANAEAVAALRETLPDCEVATGG